jgi:hypothetical protein
MLSSLLLSASLSAADFIRGDANGDRKVTISDTSFLFGAMFLGRSFPECVSAGDANDDGFLDLSDGIALLSGLFMGGSPPPSPFPGPGPDPTPSEFDCPSYGNGSPLEDPEARVEIASATAPGGTDRKATITVALTNSKAIGAYHLTILDGAGILADANLTSTSGLKSLAVLAGTDEEGKALENRPPDFFRGQVQDGQIEAEAVMTFTMPAEIPPGDSVPLLELRLCLEPGTPAGDYPLTLEAAELAASCVPKWGTGQNACPDTGRPIYPAMVSGTLHVAEAVASGSNCDISVPPPPPAIHILFKLQDTSGSPGAPVSVPFIVKADRPSQGFSYSIDFDETVLEAEGTHQLWTKPNGTAYEFEKFEFNNDDRIPGSSGIVEGFLAGAAVISLTDTGEVLPPSEEVAVLQFDFLVKPSTPTGSSTELVFQDGAPGSGGPVPNKIIAGGKDITPSLAGSFLFVNARINIVADVTLFIRGDANGDRLLDISDPVTTLGYLYLGELVPPCLDGADATDDGKLDIADPVVTLEHLFKGGGSLAAPNGRPGADPTPDDLTCAGSAP